MCFNSKLVRLKAGGNLATVNLFHQFQFQTGAIKRAAGPAIACGPILRFNSKLVRLKGILSLRPFAVCTHVSIPNWCD